MREQDTRISGEDALIARIAALIESAGASRRPLNGIGDDVAVWQPSRSHRSVITTDASVEGVHFRRDLMNLHDAGYRAMASNLSDAAASGARPVVSTVALALPEGTATEDVLALYRGMIEAASSSGCAIAGGDITRAPVLSVAIALVAEVRAPHFKGRGGARPGDVIAVSGQLGAARAGLLCAQGSVAIDSELAAAALAAFRKPQARVAQGRHLGASAHVHAMMDLSDGLSTDLLRMCSRSRCGAVVERVPVAACAKAAAASLGQSPQAFALAGGEDFELLAAISPRAFTHVSSRFERRFGLPLHAVGRFREGSGAAVLNGGREAPLESTGYDHLSNAAPGR